MNVLVTGAAGFIGRHLVRSLLQEGHRTFGIDNFATSDARDLRHSGLVEGGLQFVEEDITSQRVPHLLSGHRFDEIYHLACPTGVPNLGPLALEMLLTSFDGTRAVLEAARATGARLLFASSAEVYGNPLVSPQSEHYHGNVDPLGPRKGYEEGKRVAETLCGIYAERYGVKATVVRIFNTYGPGMALDETRVVPAFVRSALEGRPIRIHGDGSQTRCHMFVADLVYALRAAMEVAAAGRAYNLGSTDAVSVLELASTIKLLTSSSSPIEFVGRPAHDHDTRLPDIQRATSELGWRPGVPLDDGLRATIDDFRWRLVVNETGIALTQV